jgi:hypothetical protein
MENQIAKNTSDRYNSCQVYEKLDTTKWSLHFFIECLADHATRDS